MNSWGRLAGLVLVSLCASCGYTFPGLSVVLPGGGATIAVEPFSNATQEPGLVSGIQQAVELEIAKRGSFELLNSGRADVVLSGSIRSLDVRPVGFSRGDEALQYETVMTVNAWLRSRQTGKIVWRANQLRQSDSYGATSATVVAQSSAFQEQSTLNESDLLRLSDVQVSESQQGEALVRLYENLARELYNAMVDNF